MFIYFVRSTTHYDTLVTAMRDVLGEVYLEGYGGLFLKVTKGASRIYSQHLAVRLWVCHADEELERHDGRAFRKATFENTSSYQEIMVIFLTHSYHLLKQC